MSGTRKSTQPEGFICGIIYRETIEAILHGHGYKAVPRFAEYDKPIISVLVPAGEENWTKFEAFENASVSSTGEVTRKQAKSRRLAELQLEAPEAGITGRPHVHVAFYEASEDLIKTLAATKLIDRTRATQLKKELAIEIHRIPGSGNTLQ